MEEVERESSRTLHSNLTLLHTTTHTLTTFFSPQEIGMLRRSRGDTVSLDIHTHTHNCFTRKIVMLNTTIRLYMSKKRE